MNSNELGCAFVASVSSESGPSATEDEGAKIEEVLEGILGDENESDLTRDPSILEVLEGILGEWAESESAVEPLWLRLLMDACMAEGFSTWEATEDFLRVDSSDPNDFEECSDRGGESFGCGGSEDEGLCSGGRGAFASVSSSAGLMGSGDRLGDSLASSETGARAGDSE